MKECNRCKTPGLEWDREHHEKTGKWRLKDSVTSKPHYCGKEQEARGNGIWWPGPEINERVYQNMSKVVIMCNQCHENYSLTNPCDHHLPDGPRFRDRRVALYGGKGEYW